GIAVDARVVERALPDPAIVVDQFPRGAAVIRHEDAAVFRLDDGEEAVAVGARYRDAHLAPDGLRQPRIAGQFGPRRAAVRALEETAARSSAREGVRRPEHLPERGIDDIGVLRIQRQIDRAGLLVAEEHLVPGLAAVAGPEHAAVRVRAVGITKGGHEGDVRVGGMDANAGDRLRAVEADARPGLAGVDRPVDAVTLNDVAAQLGLASAGVDDVRIRRGDLDGADRGGLDLLVGH